MLINTTQQTPQQNSNLILQTTTPRPIAWIVTQDENSLINIAPYSLFTPLSFESPTIIVSFRAKEDNSIKDTLRNIRQNRKCTICMVQRDDVERMHQTSQELPSNQSEAKEFNIGTHTILEEYPPIISSSPIAYFCEFSQEVELEGDSAVPLILSIKEVFVDDTLIEDREGLMIDFDSVGHIVGDRYM